MKNEKLKKYPPQKKQRKWKKNRPPRSTSCETDKNKCFCTRNVTRNRAAIEVKKIKKIKKKLNPGPWKSRSALQPSYLFSLSSFSHQQSLTTSLSSIGPSSFPFLFWIFSEAALATPKLRITKKRIRKIHFSIFSKLHPFLLVSSLSFFSFFSHSIFFSIWCFLPPLHQLQKLQSLQPPCSLSPLPFLLLSFIPPSLPPPFLLSLFFQLRTFWICTSPLTSFLRRSDRPQTPSHGGDPCCLSYKVFWSYTCCFFHKCLGPFSGCPFQKFLGLLNNCLVEIQLFTTKPLFPFTKFRLHAVIEVLLFGPETILI